MDARGTDGDHSPRLRALLHSRGAKWVGVACLAFLLSLGVRSFAFEVFVVPSGSMLPTLQIGDRIVVDKIPGLAHDIHRGNIIVFRRAPGDTDPQYPILVKRVIGLPGDTLRSSGDILYVNGRTLAEPWLSAMNSTPTCAQASFDIPLTRVPRGQYYVLGDCRGDSSDSRVWGTVPVANVIGRVTLVIWRHNHPWFHWF
jgi:signal peptidase I